MVKTKMMINNRSNTDGRVSGRGFTLVELLLVLAVSAIVTAIALPQLANSRRLQRLAAIPKLVSSQLRLARQMAMSQRRAVTFQYDDQNKQIKIITQPSSGKDVLSDANYPTLTGSVTVSTTPLTGSGITTGDITYGIPSSAPTSAPTSALGDNTTMTALVNNKVNITFQPNGGVINASEQPTSFALYFYNSSKPGETASAISVLGSAGRVKIWRFSSNASKYVE
jgi:prepilin-type N-terminal cleavage/methylation domain-containing protein